MKFISVGILAAIFLICISSTIARSLADVEGVTEDDYLVNTTTGWVRGAYGGRTAANNPFYAFRSIPFAEPPVGNLRFEPPVPKQRWEGVLDVSKKGAECLQGSDPVRGSEDCLFLKVYTSTLPKEQKKLPVMIWIYGGAFFMGAPDFDDNSPDLLLDQGVIVAALHYRVGIFGFLSTEDLVVPGNNGLKDQVLALKWIKENIARFGGDPDNITVFGQSAGAASIAYLLQTDHTKGLFNRAILQSGVSLSLWSLSRMGLDMAQTVASDLGVSASNTRELVDGLRSFEAEELQKIQSSAMIYKAVTDNPRDGLFFAPVIEPEHEGAILTRGSHQLLTEGKFHHVPILMGYTSLEALLQEIPDMLRVWLLTYDLQNSKLVPIDMNIASLLRRASVGRTIKNEYFGNALLVSSNREIMEFISDDQFERPIQEAARLYAARTPVYFYRFSHEGSLFGVTERPFSGVGHTEDLGYLFDFRRPGSEADFLTRDRMVKLWTNFAKTGDPTPTRDPLLQNLHWEPNQAGDKITYLEINTTLSIGENPNAREISFWDNLYKTEGIPPYDTY